MSLIISNYGIINAQSKPLITDSGTVLKKGFYRNFEEFRTNSPSLFIPCEANYWEEKGIDLYKIYVFTYSSSITLDRKLEVWGYCDGKDVYVRQIEPFSKESKYSKLQFIGRYCYYQIKLIGYINHASMTVSGNFESFGSSKSKIPIIKTTFYNINNGKSYELTKSVLKAILSSDDELSKMFTEEYKKMPIIYQNEQEVVDREELLKKYLKLYSLKYKEEIKR